MPQPKSIAATGGNGQKNPFSKDAASLMRGTYAQVGEYGKLVRTPLAAFFNNPKC